MASDENPKKDKAGKASGLAAWLRKRAERRRMQDAAKQIAQSVAARLVAGALAAGFVGGAVADQTLPRVSDNPPTLERVPSLEQVAAVEELASGLEQSVGLLNELAEELDRRIGALASALTAGGSVTQYALDEMRTDMANLTQDIGVVAGMVDGHARDLDALTANQNTLGVRSERVDRRLTVVEAGLDTVSVTASNARAAAIEAGDLAREALDGADAVADAVASLADQVDALAQGVEDQAAELDALAAELGSLADDLAVLTGRVDDLERRMQAEEAERPVVAEPYDDSDLRAIIPVHVLQVDGETVCNPGPSIFGRIYVDPAYDHLITVTIAFDWQDDPGEVRVELRDPASPPTLLYAGHTQRSGGTYKTTIRVDAGRDQYLLFWLCSFGTTDNRQVTYTTVAVEGEPA